LSKSSLDEHTCHCACVHLFACFGRETALLNKPTQLPPADAAAFIARKLGASFALIDCPDGVRMMVEATNLNLTKLQDDGQLVEEYFSDRRRLTEEALGESLAASFQLWAESDPGSGLLQFAVGLAQTQAVMPERRHITTAADPKDEQEASAHRERGMCRNIIDLCSGKLIVRKRKPVRHSKRVVAIVGRGHVAPLIALLKAA
jgi:hypothetical protein